MGWFSKKEEIKYYYLGIRETLQFRNEIDRFIDLDKFFRETDKIYTEKELINISTTLTQAGKEIDIIKSFCWVTESEYQSQINDTKINIDIENFKLIKSIEINMEFLNFIYFDTTKQKQDVLKVLENKISETKYFLNLKDTDNRDLTDILYEQNVLPDLPIVKFYIIEWGIYSIWKTEGNDYLLITKRESFSNINFSDELENDSNLLRYNLFNLKRKINSNCSDISTEEKNILKVLNKTDFINLDRGVGYDYLESLLVLGKFYFEKDKKIAISYFEKANIDWSEISSNVVSKTFREIGELFMNVNDNQKAIYWLKKGLELNPKLGVLKLIEKLES